MFAADKPATCLRTAREIALARAAEIEKLVARRERAQATAERQQARRMEWAKRLDPAAYTCRKDGQVWRAEGPAGQTFTFLRDASDPAAVVCCSQSGSDYRIARDEVLGEWTCTCPTSPEQAGPHGCKHLVGWHSVRTAHAMSREKVAASQPAETQPERITRLQDEAKAHSVAISNPNPGGAAENARRRLTGELACAATIARAKQVAA